MLKAGFLYHAVEKLAPLSSSRETILGCLFLAAAARAFNPSELDTFTEAP